MSLSEKNPQTKNPKPNSQAHALPTKNISAGAACLGLSQGRFAIAVLFLGVD